VSLEPPDFVREGGGVNAVAEFRKFAAAIEEPAAHVLAELAEIHNLGTEADIPASDGASTKVRGLYCRQIMGWAVFYAAVSKPNPFRIVVLHVAHMNPHPFAALESEAESRLRRLQR
jgi:hypothetical protein